MPADQGPRTSPTEDGPVPDSYDSPWKEFAEKLAQYEQEDKMPYVSMIEQVGIEKGIEQGLQQGLQRGVLRVLTTRFGPVPRTWPKASASSMPVGWKSSPSLPLEPNRWRPSRPSCRPKTDSPSAP